MEVIPTEIPAVKLLVAKRFADARGFFSELYSRETMGKAGIDFEFVQDNFSFSNMRGTVRALHYQIAPMAQTKLVRVMRGAVKDVAVDIRRGSPTFGKHVSMLLSSENWRAALVPVGFAHGFVTLEADTEVMYKVTAPYAPKHERGIRWNDPALGIDWGVSESEATLNDRDRAHPALKDAADVFDYSPEQL